MVNGKTNLWYAYTGLPMKYTHEWILNGTTVSTDSAFITTQPGIYTLRLEFPCQRVERTIVLNTMPLLVKNIDICKGDSVFIKGKFRHVSGDFTDTFSRPAGDCDSLVKYELRVHGLPVKPRDSVYYLCELRNEAVFLDAGVYDFYKWYPGGDTTKWKKVNKVGTYWVTVGEDHTCTDSVKMDVRDNCDLSCFIPNAFSPNGDGSNDFFPPALNGVADYDFEVYSRWGELLYRSQDYRWGWDGYYMNKLCPESVYLYIIRFTISSSQKVYNFSGTFTLLR